MEQRPKTPRVPCPWKPTKPNGQHIPHTHAFIYYNLRAVPKGGGGLCSSASVSIAIRSCTVITPSPLTLSPNHLVPTCNQYHVATTPPCRNHTPITTRPSSHAHHHTTIITRPDSATKYYLCITLLWVYIATLCNSVVYVVYM